MRRRGVAAFRADAARAGASSQVDALVSELSARSPEFAALWRDHEVRSHSEGIKQLRHPVTGALTLEYSAFAVDGRPDLGMVVYNPVAPTDLQRMQRLIASLPPAGG